MAGTLVLHGGGETKAATTRRLIELAGGPSATIVVLPQVREDPATSGARSADWLKENGATSVFVATISSPDDPAMPAVFDALKSARGVWIPGGDQNRLIERFGRHPIAAAVRRVVARGGAAGGSSAGLALMGERMPTGEGDARTLARDAIESRDALNCAPGVLFDTHFLVRERLPRLLNLVLSHPNLTGVGFDEGAWGELSGRQLTVRDGQAVILWCARPPKSEANAPLTAADLRMRVAGPGEIVALRR